MIKQSTCFFILSFGRLYSPMYSLRQRCQNQNKYNIRKGILCILTISFPGMSLQPFPQFSLPTSISSPLLPTVFPEVFTYNLRKLEGNNDATAWLIVPFVIINASSRGLKNQPDWFSSTLF